MKGQCLFYSSNGYNRLEAYTKKTYGERGTFQHNIMRYLNSEEFFSTCRVPQCVDDIPEVSFEDIRRQIDWEGLHIRQILICCLYTKNHGAINSAFWRKLNN